jgi:putative endonuclease
MHPFRSTPFHERRSYCVYILSSLSGTLYISMTGNLHKRVFEHKFHRIEGFTDRYDVGRLLYFESFDDPRKAIDREKQLKGWRREKKIRLIEKLNPHWADLAKDWYPWMESSSNARGASTPKIRPEDESSPLSMTGDKGSNK